MSSSTTNPNEKTVRLVDYLLRLTTLRSKRARDVAEYEKVLWLSSIPHERGCFTQAWGRDQEHESDEWIEIKNSREPEFPNPPTLCRKWVDETTLKNKDDLPKLLPEMTRRVQNPNWYEGSVQPKTTPQTEYLVDHPTVQTTWDRYLQRKWQPWAKLHRSWEKIHKIYSSLFAIHRQQLRLGEQYELVLGLGLLTWQTPSGQRARRHLVVANANLEFEARLGQFTIRPHAEGAKLRAELDMLDLEERPAHAEETAKEMLAGAQDDPWKKESIEGVLQALVHSISSQGHYNDTLQAESNRTSSKPIVEYAPALILRKRSTRGLTEALRRIRKQIDEGVEVPREFADLAEVHTKSEQEQKDGSSDTHSEFDGEVFFPKPSNDEQRRIVDKMNVASGVLVQGPPGTGKSHTIANLVCHLLATGQRTLITAKTPRALQVLKKLIPSELHPLCINLLGSGLEERRSLESSVGGILRKNEEWKEDLTKLKRAQLEKNLQDLREEKSKLEQRIRDIRESETQTQSVAEGAYQGTAARIAQAVNRDHDSYQWFSDSVTVDKACPISTKDLRSVLETLRHFTPEKRKELELASPKALISSEDFADLVKNEIDATKERETLKDGADERFADLLTKSDRSTVEAIRDLLSTFHDTRKSLMAVSHSWMNDALRDILGGNSSLWQERLRVTQNTISSVEEYITIADDTSLEFPDTCDAKVLREDARQLKKHLDNGGQLGWWILRPNLVKERLYVLESVKLNGRFCLTSEHFTTLANILNVHIECEKAWDYWNGLSDKVQGPYALQLTTLKSLSKALENALSLEEMVSSCHEAIQQCPEIKAPVWSEEAQVEKIILSCRLALASIHRGMTAEEIERIETPVSSIAAKSNAHPVSKELLLAIRDRNLDGFAQSRSKIQDLDKERLRLREVKEELEKLRHRLPHLVDCLESTSHEPHWEDRVEQIEDAWHWAQARYWIDEYIKQEDLPALAKRAKQIEDEENSLIAQLSSLYAWSFCFSRLKEEHRRHMEAWQQSMRRLGKGTGKYAPRHRREAQGHLNECREAVPAWIMPLHRVWDTAYPSPGMFDVIIVDEASQCGFEALPLFYLGKKILIVGDDKQISPEAVGMRRDTVNRLMEEFLYDFRFKSSFDVESSLFDHGKLRYGTRRITLREHFRCMPEIIRFSNDLCYSDTPLIPLRQYGPNRLPPLEQNFVQNGYREGTGNRTINRPEARAIATKIAELCQDSRYDDMSIGVVVLQGEAQASLIEDQLLERLGAEEMERRRLICGNSYSFQGDERDIMFLSMVAANNERIGSLTKASDERRFNVAASRARDKMILFHSVTCDDLGTNCLRRKLLDFFENTTSQQVNPIDQEQLERRATQDNRLVVSPPKPFESWFEVDLTLELLRKNLTVIPQYKVAGKHIDLVVEGGQARLAIECDGDQWHGAEQYEDDMHRQRQLERCGWEFFRVRESAFYFNKNDALLGLWQALEERDIL